MVVRTRQNATRGEEPGTSAAVGVEHADGHHRRSIPSDPAILVAGGKCFGEFLERAGRSAVFLSVPAAMPPDTAKSTARKPSPENDRPKFAR